MVEEALVEGQAARAGWTERIAAEPPEAILADPALMATVRQTAPALFGDNCAPCHGADAQGGPGFPNLLDGDWIWGGDYDTLMETVRVGVNADHPGTGVAQMMAFGRDGMLSRPEIREVAAYVRSLSGGARRRRRRERSSSRTTARPATARPARAWPSSAPRT
jgi:cytochrome c oxidase cbb3-type subunit 3